MADAALADELRGRGIVDERVLRAIASLQRSDFVPSGVKGQATGDFPLPIGFGQTISQPYIVAFMTERLALQGHERVLEIGTGSGYQTAVLLSLCEEVYSLEIVPSLAERARRVLPPSPRLHLREGDGAAGWPEAAPFDRILLTAAPEEVPPLLLTQLARGGILVAPVGPVDGPQALIEVRDGMLRPLLPVRFVPLTEAPPGAAT